MNQKLELLDKELILQKIKSSNLDLLSSLNVRTKTGSTNNDAKKDLKDCSIQLSANLAEQQESGRGRSGKKWTSPFAQNIYFSLGWKTHLSLLDLDGLSLSAGVVVSETLQEFSSATVLIKWPNDLLINKKKIGGILIETAPGDNNNLDVIIGIGINVFMSDAEGKKIDQDWTNLQNFSTSRISRNDLAASLLNRIIELTVEFEQNGFKNYIQSFNLLHTLRNKECLVIANDKSKKIGIVEGINEKGELLIKINNEIINLRYGEVSIREL